MYSVKRCWTIIFNQAILYFAPKRFILEGWLLTSPFFSIESYLYELLVPTNESFHSWVITPELKPFQLHTFNKTLNGNNRLPDWQKKIAQNVRQSKEQIHACHSTVKNKAAAFNAWNKQDATVYSKILLLKEKKYIWIN